jgi:hypothetical protein
MELTLLVRMPVQGRKLMEVEQEIECRCPKCGHTYRDVVYIEIDPSDLAQDTYGD